MHLFFVVVVGFGLLTWAAFDYERASGRGSSAIAQDMAGTEREVAAYRTFIAATLRVMPHAPFTGTSVQTRTWGEIRSHAMAPSFARTVEMPTNWAIRGNSTGWAACTPMSEHAIMQLSANIPQSMGAARMASVRRGDSHFAIMGEGDAARQTEMANWCYSFLR